MLEPAARRLQKRLKVLSYLENISIQINRFLIILYLPSGQKSTYNNHKREENLSFLFLSTFVRSASATRMYIFFKGLAF